eukprot:scaffold5605_cov128-Cylindrotheca_fusiformis.AAC.12
MGNALFCNENKCNETVQLKKDQPQASLNPSSNNKRISDDVPRGYDGLAFFGFEYRHIHCPNHGAATRSASAAHSHCCDRDCLLFCRDCTTRLFHLESNTMIDETNCKQLLRCGKLFDNVSQCCQDIAQQQLQDQFNLHVVTIMEGSKDSGEGPIQALVSPDLAESNLTASLHVSKPIFLLIGGKGKSRAGVLSVKQLLVSGIEKGSAIFHVVQAAKRGYSIIILDPNARGETRGKSTIDRSLSYFFHDSIKENMITSSISKRPLYVMAHSAAGGFLARYLNEGHAPNAVMQRIFRLVFTDSTHNIQWFKDNPPLLRFLQSSRCLYIRNTSENPSDTFSSHRNKKAGEPHEGNVWWHRRFGNLPTVWAGTPEHSLMCWVARYVIWDFFVELENEGCWNS